MFSVSNITLKIWNWCKVLLDSMKIWNLHLISNSCYFFAMYMSLSHPSFCPSIHLSYLILCSISKLRYSTNLIRSLSVKNIRTITTCWWLCVICKLHKNFLSISLSLYPREISLYSCQDILFYFYDTVCFSVINSQLFI